MKAYYEPIVLLETNSFKAESQVKKSFDVPWHYHPEYELTYITSSDGIRYVGNNMENFRAGDLVLLGPNLPHCWKNTANLETVAEAVVVQWQENLMGTNWMDTLEFASIQRLLKLSKRGIKFGERVSQQTKTKLYRLLELKPFEKLLSFLEILHALAEADDYEHLCDHDYDCDINFDDSERVNTVYQYVKFNYQRKITLDDVARQVNMSKGYFSRYFSNIMKKAFFTFLNEYRISNACRMLIDTDLQIAEIGYTCGYENVPYFHKQFKKIKGVSPQQYRAAFVKTHAPTR